MSVPYSAPQSPAKPPYARWTNHEDQALARMVNEGKTRGEIAHALGRSRNSVHMRRKKFGALLKNGKAGNPKFARTWTDFEEQLLVDMTRRRYSIQEITVALGRSWSSVWTRSQRLGLKRRVLRPQRVKIQPASAVFAESLTICKAELIQYYEQGCWRVEWHEGDRIGLVWKSCREPRML